MEEFVNVELNEIQRQAADSGIIVDANLIREGISPVTLEESKVIRGNKRDLFYIFKSSKEELFRIAVASFMKSVKEKGIGNVVILVPFKKKSLNSTKEFNRVIQEELNSENKNVKFIHGDKEFWLNDSVIHVVNNYDKDIFNGFQGVVSKIETNKMYVDYGDKVVEYDHSDINELELSYALTTWKYQGSEIKDVIIVMDSSHYVLLSSQYLYCSLTRAKERALILSDKYAFKRCLSEDKSVRQTWLKEIINDEN
jgi:ATP-dependent exoDNAse (exonuclease V) alpha subunit